MFSIRRIWFYNNKAKRNRFYNIFNIQGGVKNNYVYQYAYLTTKRNF